MEKSCPVKLTPLLATPSTVTSTFPVVAPLGTVVVMLVPLQFEFATVAGVPLNVTALVPCVDPKFFPVIVTVAPTGPALGFRLVITGAATEIVSASVALPVPVALVALSVTDDVPAPVVIPEINPVELFTDSPAGNPMAP